MDGFRVEFHPLATTNSEHINNICRLMEIIKEDYAISRKRDLEYSYQVYEIQLIYIKLAIKDSYYVAAYDEVNNYIGGVLLFLTYAPPKINPPTPVFEGIAKSLYGLERDSIKLNRLLIPSICEFLKQKGYTCVRAQPVHRQEQILINHYNFKMEYDKDGYDSWVKLEL